MKNSILFFSYLLFAFTCSAQYLNIDELLNLSKKKPSSTTDYLINKGWKLNSSNKEMSPDGSALFGEYVTWSYNVNLDGGAQCWVQYRKELNLDPIKPIGYYTDLIYSFSNLQYYNKLNMSIKIKGWKTQQDEVMENRIVKTFNQGDFSVVLMIQNNNNESPYVIMFHKLTPSKE